MMLADGLKADSRMISLRASHEHGLRAAHLDVMRNFINHSPFISASTGRRRKKKERRSIHWGRMCFIMFLASCLRVSFIQQTAKHSSAISRWEFKQIMTF